MLNTALVRFAPNGEYIDYLSIHVCGGVGGISPNDWVWKSEPDDIESMDEMLNSFRFGAVPIVGMRGIRLLGGQLDCVRHRPVDYRSQ